MPAALVEPGRCLVMGVVNVTPDSFSDGGRWFDIDTAIEHGLELAGSGADLVDVGGESTRPGARRVPVQEELRRVIPVVRALVAAGVVVSIDTMRAEVADAALDGGATLVNDVSGGLADPSMPPLVARAGVPYVVMHWRGHSRRMATMTHYRDVVTEVCQALSDRLSHLLDAGVALEQLVVDPGLGFAKEAEHNWALLAGLERVKALGRPVLVGASRKRFLRALLGEEAVDRGPAGPAESVLSGLDAATGASSALAAAAGAWCVRVHDVRTSAVAVRVASSWATAGAASADVASGDVASGVTSSSSLERS